MKIKLKELTKVGLMMKETIKEMDKRIREQNKETLKLHNMILREFGNSSDKPGAEFVKQYNKILGLHVTEFRIIEQSHRHEINELKMKIYELKHDIKYKYVKKKEKILNKNPNKRLRTPIDSRLRHEVFKRDGYRCLECGATFS